MLIASPCAAKFPTYTLSASAQHFIDRVDLADVPDTLASVLDTSRPDLQAVVDLADDQGLRPAIEALRKVHAGVPKQKYLKEYLSYTRDDADAVLANGYQRDDLPAYGLQHPIRWEDDPYHNRSWRYSLNAWSFLDAVLSAYEETGDTGYIRYAKDIMIDWFEYHVEKGKSNRFSWYEMGVGVRADRLAVVLDFALRNDQVSDLDVVKLLVIARIHLLDLTNPERLAIHSNHGLYQIGGLLALLNTIPEIKGTQKGLIYADRQLRVMLERHFTAEGIHREHSPDYHMLLTNQLGQLIATGWLDNDPWVASLFSKTYANIVWLAHPTGNVVAVGDSDEIMLQERMTNPGPSLEYAYTQGTSGEPPASNYAVFPESGYAVFRSDWKGKPFKDASFLFFSAAFHSRQHKHADDFTFVWSEFGRRLLVDSGVYGYFYKAPERKYVESTRAHNTVEIDGRDYSRYRLDAFGSALTAWGKAGPLYVVEAELYRKRFFKTRHRRLLVFHPGHWLVVVDQLESKEPHDYTQWFHFDPAIQLQPGGGVYAADIEGMDIAMNVIPLHAEAVESVLIEGQTEPRLQGWISREAKTLTPNDALGYKQHGKQAVFATLLWLGAVDQRPVGELFRVRGDRVQLEWKYPDGRKEGFVYHKDESGASLSVIGPDRKQYPLQVRK